jgi:hypothetical protein
VKQVTLPLNIAKRGLSKDEAAEYCGVSANTLGKHGPPPTKIGERIIYDRRVLDRWLDELAGLAPALRSGNPEEQLLKAIHARQAPVRRTSR